MEVLLRIQPFIWLSHRKRHCRKKVCRRAGSFELPKFKQQEFVLASDYTVDKIQIMEGLDAVRMRPGMYIGSTGQRGLHHLLWEIIDNSIDEAANGYANEITVTLHKDNSVTVTDNGRGIPCRFTKKRASPALKSCLRSCTPAASSATIPTATPAGCTALARRLSTRSPNILRLKSIRTSGSYGYQMRI